MKRTIVFILMVIFTLIMCKKDNISQDMFNTFPLNNTKTQVDEIIEKKFKGEHGDTPNGYSIFINNNKTIQIDFRKNKVYHLLITHYEQQYSSYVNLLNGYYKKYGEPDLVTADKELNTNNDRIYVRWFLEEYTLSLELISFKKSSTYRIMERKFN